MLLSLSLGPSLSLYAQSHGHPNILILLADDLGWNDVGYHGSQIKTPHIDRLADGGVVLDQHYVTPMCSTTRAALLSGRHPSRFGCLNATNSRVFQPGMNTLASALRDVGYKTYLTGKWHLGSLPKWGPLKFGFDRSYGALAGGVDQYLHLYKKGPFARTWHRNDKYLDEEGHATNLIADEAIRWIQEQRSDPFFIQVAFTAVHIPLQEPDQWLRQYEHIAEKSRRHYAACTSHMDAAIGRIIDALRETNKLENTLILFTSDNGGQEKWVPRGSFPGQYFDCPVLGDNQPLRGFKGQMYEGGIRVPALIHWPARLKPGLHKDPIHIVDWMPTLCHLVGCEQEEDLNWDGQDIWSTLSGESQEDFVRTFYWRMENYSALRHGDWKFIVSHQGQDNELYYLKSDPYETKDLASKEPDRVAELHEIFVAQRALDSADVLPFIPDVSPLDLPGTVESLDRKITEGTTIRIEGPPSKLRDTDKRENSAAAGERVLEPRRALPAGVYQEVRKNWLMTQHSDASRAGMVTAIRKRYGDLILPHVTRPNVTHIDVEHQTLIYPPMYYGNSDSVSVPAKRLTIHALDEQNRPRHLVAYYVNYDKTGPHKPDVVFQVNGHFGRNPSRLGLGIEAQGGYSGAALGKLAIAGIPLITYDDHDIGESSPAEGDENGLYRTLSNLAMMDDSLLVHFEHVDVLGLSGGTERLYHFSMFHRANIRSAYFAGYFTPLWIYLDNRDRTGGPFGYNSDTYNETFQSFFQWADLVLVAIDHIPHVAMANNTYEGGISKSGFVNEMLPALRKFTNRFQVRGDDSDCDGKSNTRKNLSHEYDLEDYLQFLYDLSEENTQ